MSGHGPQAVALERPASMTDRGVGSYRMVFINYVSLGYNAPRSGSRAKFVWATVADHLRHDPFI